MKSRDLFQSAKGRLARARRLSAPRASIQETAELIKSYVIQETLEPLKATAKMFAWGLLGAILLGIGGIFLLIGVLRVLQDETNGAFRGAWQFAPYVLTAVVGAIGVAGVAFMIYRVFSLRSFSHEDAS